MTKNNLLIFFSLKIFLDFQDLGPLDLLRPFLDVIKSGDATGPITGMALSSIERFIKYQLLGNISI